MSGSAQGSGESHEGGVCRKTIILVDASLNPHTNKRGAKLGAGLNTFASAALGYDPRSKRMTMGDGTGSLLARYPFEPDNWILRKHAAADVVWAARLTVDKTNKAQDKKNRSTHVIDQDDNQRYGNFADLFWICETGVDCDISVSDAGYSGSGSGTRDALALSMAENEGFISDGENFGQLAHILTFLEDDTPTEDGGDRPTTPTGGGGGTPTQGGPINPPGNSSGEVTFPPGAVGSSGEVQRPPASIGGSGEVSNPTPGQPNLSGGQKPVDTDAFPPNNPNDPLHTGKF